VEADPNPAIIEQYKVRWQAVQCSRQASDMWARERPGNGCGRGLGSPSVLQPGGAHLADCRLPHPPTHPPTHPPI
jgi:hypothetical protein